MRLPLSAGRVAAAERGHSPDIVILLLAFATSLLIALLRGGSLGALSGLSFRWGWVALVACCAQALVIYNPLPGLDRWQGYRPLLLLGSYAALVWIVLLNRRLPGMPLVGLGLSLNLLVMLMNGGLMPITWEALHQAGLTGLALGSEAGSRIMATKDILLPREQTRLWILSDILVIPAQLSIRSVCSIGDVLLAGGIFWLFQRTMRKPSSGPCAQKPSDQLAH